MFVSPTPSLYKLRTLLAHSCIGKYLARAYHESVAADSCCMVHNKQINTYNKLICDKNCMASSKLLAVA